jgi:hypothetical protein
MKTKFALILVACIAVFAFSFVSASQPNRKLGKESRPTEVSKTNEPVGGFGSADQL